MQELSITDYVRALSEYAKDISIIYAEDDAIIAQQVKHFLDKFFSNVRMATDGEQALELYMQKTCDLLVTDIIMPKLDGIALCEAISNISDNQKIIVTSAHNESDYLIKLINLGISKFLLKPFDNKAMVRSFYGACKEIYDARENVSLHNKLEENYNQIQRIIDFIEDAIITLENSQITRANRCFLGLANFNTMEDFIQSGLSLKSFFANAKGYSSYESDADFFDKLRTDGAQKVLLKNSLGISVFLARLKPISDCVELITFSDVTCIEKDLLTNKQKLLINPFTGIPNKTAFIEKLYEISETRTFGVAVISLQNYQNILKWLGKQKAQDAEKCAVDSLKALFESKKYTGYLANYDKNCFVYSALPQELLRLKEDIKTIEITYLYLKGDEQEKMFIKLHMETLRYDGNMETLLDGVDKAAARCC